MNKIESVNLCLRSIIETDIYKIFSYRSLQEVARYQYWEPFTIRDTIAFVEQCSTANLETKNQWIGLAVVLKENNDFIGDCALKINDNSAEIGINIAPEYQKLGFAKEAISLLINYCFQKEHVNEVFGITDSMNTASIKLMESVGMIRDTDFENIIECKGNISVEHRYSINRI